MTQRPIRLGLPWQLQHYKPLNGAHPLVLSFLEGNGAVEPVAITPVAATVPRETQTRVLARMARQTCPVPDALLPTFLDWLSLPDQVAIESQASACDALFLHTAPLHAATAPWIFHFESFPSLFMPFMFTGQTRGIALRSQGWFAQVRDQLASPDCKRIFSHMRSSLEILARVFDSADIAAKCHHVPLGIGLREPAEWLPKFEPGGRLRILFTNSLHGHPSSFYLRGGHHLLEAFALLRKQRPDAELTVLSAVPSDLTSRFPSSHFIGVNWINSRVDDATLDQLFLGHQLFALPAAGLHSHSLLRAMAHGCVPIVSDALGYEEYTAAIEDSVMVLRGVRDMVYRDEPEGWVSDRYEPYLAPSPGFAQQIHDRIAERAQPAALREMALRNLEHCRRRHAVPASHDAFNRMLQGR